MSGADGARLAALAASTALALAGCASALPGEVDHEAVALDLGACLRGEPSCETAGAVQGAAALFAGDHAVALYAPASVTLPLLRTSGGRRLRWLALGVRSYASASLLRGGTLSVKVSDRPAVSVIPDPGFSRVELDMNDLVPPEGTKVTIAMTDGQLQLVYAVGRWDD